jgi:tRNA-2-methylthio-N6-dimethylallyladenosine synthase
VSAKLFDDDIPDAVKRSRLQEVQNLQREISFRKNRERIGDVEEIFVDGKSRLRNGQMMGRTRTNRIVNLMGQETLVGSLLPVRIIGATANSLIGEELTVERVSDFRSEGEMA